MGTKAGTFSGFTKHRIATMMPVKDLIKGLGAPVGIESGIGETDDVGDGRFTAGITITQGSEEA